MCNEYELKTNIALWDITDLMNKGVLSQIGSIDRSTNYRLLSLQP